MPERLRPATEGWKSKLEGTSMFSGKVFGAVAGAAVLALSATGAFAQAKDKIKVVVLVPNASVPPPPAGRRRARNGGGPQSCRTRLSSELFTLSPPLYSISPSLRNLFMKKFTRERVVPTISASVSWDSFGRTCCVASACP